MCVCVLIILGLSICLFFSVQLNNSCVNKKFHLLTKLIESILNIICLCTDDDSDADLVTDYLDALPTAAATTTQAEGPSLTANSTLSLLDKSAPIVPQVASNIKTYFVSTVDISKKKLMSKNNGSNSDLGIDVGNGSCGQQQQQQQQQHTHNHSNLNNNNTITITTSTGHNNNNINIINNNNHHNNNNSINMVPIISVTPHSPGAKYNSILEDSLNHLQSIRETVCQMKNSSTQNTTFGTIGIINPTVRFSKHFISSNCVI